MPFKEGQSGNPSGRPKGAKDKKTLQWEKFSEWFMGRGMERLEEEMGKLKGKDYVLTVKDLLEYFKPKLARTSTEIDFKGSLTVDVPDED